MGNRAVMNERLRQYLKAEEVILCTGQSYVIGNRTLTRANIGEIRKEINSLLAQGATVDDSYTPASRAKQVIMKD